MCDQTRHACATAEAVMDMSMPDLAPIACSESSMCSVPTEPICDQTMKRCRACSMPDGGAVSSECTALSGTRPLCSSSGACVQCITNRDCITANLSCDTAAGSCVPCQKNSDCASGICGAGGACADPTMLIYVNKSGVSCPGGNGQGTLDDPYCTIQTGFNAAAMSGHKVVVFSGTYSENVTIQSGTAALTINAVGIGQPAISPPSTATAPALKLSSTGSSITVSLDGFVIQNAIGGSGVDCSGPGATSVARVSLIRSTVSNNAQYGIFASKCLLSTDQTTVAQNAKGGMSLDASDATIQNTIVHHNGAGSGATFGGIYMTNTSGTINIISSTVVANATGGGALSESGISCNGTVNIFDTVIHSNTGSAAEINATGCPPDHSAFVGAALANMSTNSIDLTTCTDSVLFVDSTNANYTPRGGAGNCSLIDTGAASHLFGATTVNAPTYDLIGTSRPQKGGFDIGALEAM